MSKKREIKLIRLALRLIKKPSVVGVLLLILATCQYYQKDIYKKESVGTEVRVIDGDTIALKEQRIRLKGIDAPELKKSCSKRINGYKKSYRCGEEARDYLIQLIANKEVKCTDEGRDKYGRMLSYCYQGDVDLNRGMVRAGYAVASRGYDLSFIAEEKVARIRKVGLWQGEFKDPKEWRRAKKKKGAVKQKEIASMFKSEVEKPPKVLGKTEKVNFLCIGDLNGK